MKTNEEYLADYDCSAFPRREKGPDEIVIKGDFVMAKYNGSWVLATRAQAEEYNLEYEEIKGKIG